MGQRGQEETEAVQADQKCSEESRSVLMDQERILYMSGQKTDVSHIRVRIDTGRTHQIRVHMASIGYPLIGDILYNPRYMEYNSKSRPVLQLCAWRAELRQPFTGEVLQFQCASEKCDLTEKNM